MQSAVVVVAAERIKLGIAVTAVAVKFTQPSLIKKHYIGNDSKCRIINNNYTNIIIIIYYTADI